MTPDVSQIEHSYVVALDAILVALPLLLYSSAKLSRCKRHAMPSDRFGGSSCVGENAECTLHSAIPIVFTPQLVKIPLCHAVRVPASSVLRGLATHVHTYPTSWAMLLLLVFILSVSTIY